MMEECAVARCDNYKTQPLHEKAKYVERVDELYHHWLVECERSKILKILEVERKCERS